MSNLRAAFTSSFRCATMSVMMADPDPSVRAMVEDDGGKALYEKNVGNYQEVLLGSYANEIVKGEV